MKLSSPVAILKILLLLNIWKIYKSKKFLKKIIIYIYKLKITIN